MAITRTAKGTFSSKSVSSPTTVISSVSMTAGDWLFVAFGSSSNATVTDMTWNGISMGTKIINDSSSGMRVVFWALNIASSATGDLVLTGSFSSFAVAVVATSVSGLAATSALDVTVGGSSNTNTSPQDTATATNQANEFFFSTLITNGPSTDSVGTWSNSWTAGQRVGTTGNPVSSNVTAQEGYKIVSATESSQAALTGITSRLWFIYHVTYKAASVVFVANDPLVIPQAVKRASYY